MTNRRTLARRTALAAAALALVAFAAHDALRLARALRYNAALDAAAAAASAPATTPLDDAAPDLPASTLFVRAHAAAQAQRAQDARLLYLAAARDPAYTVAAHYNLGNLYLREALALAERDELKLEPLAAEQAKQHLRAALRADPTHWASKYNLEQALHLAPENPDDGAAAAGHAADRAVTSLRGFTLGLP
jgi:mxaK protein